MKKLFLPILFLSLFGTISFAAPDHHDVKIPYQYQEGKKLALKYLLFNNELTMYVTEYNVDVTKKVKVSASSKNLRSKKVEKISSMIHDDHIMMTLPDLKKNEVTIEVTLGKSKEVFTFKKD